MFQQSQIARIARMNSRILGAGCDQGMLNRRVMCGLICEPSPSRSRPFDSSCTSLACTAVDIGLRANAMTRLVPSSMRLLAIAARATATNGSCLVSLVQIPW